MRALRLMLAKDLRLLWRSPGLLGLLVLYPVVVSLLVASAVGDAERRPTVAVVNLDTAGRTVQVGEERLSVDDQLAALTERVDVRMMDAEAAARALDEGRVVGVITIPEGFIADLQSGVRRPQLQLTTGRRAPLEADALTQRLQAGVYRLNQRLAVGYVDQVMAMVDLVMNGGDLGLLGRSGSALGLDGSRELLQQVQADLRAGGDQPMADRLDPLLLFIEQTARNLGVAAPAAEAIRSPIELAVVDDGGTRAPLTALGVAGALMLSLGLAGLLLGAATMAAEREDNVLVRLGRGLAPPWAIVAAKATLTALICTVVGVVLLVLLSVVAGVAVGPWWLWPGLFIVAGLALGAAGAVAGAVARDTRGALLGALMIGLPLAALALLPAGSWAAPLAGIAPFGPAFDAMHTLLAEPGPSAADIATSVAHLALLGAVAVAIATLAVRRRSRI